MEDFVLTIPEAFAIVGSVVTVVFGIFGYLLKTRNDPPKSRPAFQKSAQQIVEDRIQHAHDRISNLKDQVVNADADVRLLNSKIDNMQKTIDDHEERDIRDFDVLNKKIDKLTDIVIKILSDESL